MKRNFLLSVMLVLPGIRSLQAQVEFNWKSVGPVNHGGSIRALQYTPDGQRVYAGSPTGGLWVSTNNGTTWSSVASYNLPTISNPLPNLGVSSIAIDPVDNTLYVGTGSASLDNDHLSTGGTPFPSVNFGKTGYLGYTGSFGSGLYVSTDNGATFIQAAGTAPASPYNVTDPFVAVQVVRAREGRVFIGTHKGLYRSDDQGASVQQATESYSPTLPSGDRLANAPIFDIEITAAGTIYVGTDKYLFISTDGGDSFTQYITIGQLPKDDSDPFFAATPLPSVVKVTVSQSDPNVVYLAMATNRLLGVWKSTDGGQNWDVIAPRSTAFDGQLGAFAPCAENNALLGGIVGYCVQAFILEVDPSNNDHVFLGSRQWYEYTPSAGWNNSTHDFPLGLLDNQYVPHLLTAFAANPAANTILLGTDKELVRSTDGGHRFLPAIGNLSVAQVYDLSVASDGYVLGTSRGMGTILFDGKSNITRSWFAPNSFLPRRAYVTVSRFSSDFMVSGSYNTFHRSLNRGAIFTNSDWMGVPLPDAPFVADTAERIVMNPNLRPPLAPVILDEVDTTSLNIALDSLGEVVNKQYVFCGSQGHVWLVRNPFDPTDSETPPSFSSIFRVNDGTNEVSALAISDDETHTLLIGTTNGRLIRITHAHDPANSVVQEIITPASDNTPDRWITSITFHPTNKDTVVVTYGTFRNDDPNGTCPQCGFIYATNAAMSSTNPTWYNQHDLISDIGFYPIYTALFNPDQESPTGPWLAIGTEKGVFSIMETELDFSAPATAENVGWLEANNGEMMRVPVYKLAYNGYRLAKANYPAPHEDKTYDRILPDFENNYIYAATWGNGVVRSGLLAFPVGRNAAAKVHGNGLRFRAFPNPSQGLVQAELVLKEASHVEISVISLKGNVVKQLAPVYLAAGKHNVPVDLQTLPAGMYILKANAGGSQAAVATTRIMVVR
ncbi:MAG: T9SS type A sorting domain-containing protein [Bacteroidetes bacterium]|nr:T9SS type A sorting domain-containing protein [Bacteroidota bacterium]